MTTIAQGVEVQQGTVLVWCPWCREVWGEADWTERAGRRLPLWAERMCPTCQADVALEIYEVVRSRREAVVA